MAPATASSSKSQLSEACTSAGQQHLLQDWDILGIEEQQQLAADLQVRVRPYSMVVRACTAATAHACCTMVSCVRVCAHAVPGTTQGLDFAFISKALQASQAAAAGAHSSCQPVQDVVSLQVRV
jgi:hypothetical protein